MIGLLCAIWLLLASASAADPASSSVAEGASSSSIKQEAIRAIPLDKLSTDGRNKVADVVADVSVYRRLPVTVVRCDPELYLFLVNRPDTMVDIWEALGITTVGFSQTGTNTYDVDDGHGTTSRVEYLYRSHDSHVVYVEGLYSGPMFARKVRARCVFFLRTGYTPEEDGHWYITHRLDAFVKIENIGADVIARTFQPMVGKVADRNFTEVSEFIGGLSRRAEADPEWTQKLASKLDGVRPDVRTEFSKITAKVAEKHAIRRTAGRHLVDDTERPVSVIKEEGVGDGDGAE